MTNNYGQACRKPGGTKMKEAELLTGYAVANP